MGICSRKGGGRARWENKIKTPLLPKKPSSYYKEELVVSAMLQTFHKVMEVAVSGCFSNLGERRD